MKKTFENPSSSKPNPPSKRKSYFCCRGVLCGATRVTTLVACLAGCSGAIMWLLMSRTAEGDTSRHFIHLYLHMGLYLMFGRPLKSTQIRGVPKSEFFECAFGPLSSHPFFLVLPLPFPFRPYSLSQHFSPLHLPLHPHFFDSRKTPI